MFYILVHDEYQTAHTYDSFIKAQEAYYRQWRRQDGTIPWSILEVNAEVKVDPETGRAIKAA